MAVLGAEDRLAPIRRKVEAGVRLDAEDGLLLAASEDVLALGELADLARRVGGGGDEVAVVRSPGPGAHALAGVDTAGRTGSEGLKAIAVARLLLAGAADVEASAEALGLPLAAVALHFGANAIRVEANQDLEEFARFVREAGRVVRL